jgi:ABC-type glycerol-3-phosphate transport system substrate-binding protein
MWALTDQTILKESVDAYNEDHPDQKITLRLFANDDCKQTLRVAFGAGQAPALFFNWDGAPSTTTSRRARSTRSPTRGSACCGSCPA